MTDSLLVISTDAGNINVKVTATQGNLQDGKSEKYYGYNHVQHHYRVNTRGYLDHETR